MKATGIVRRIDDLGRVVIPKEIRRTLRLREGTPLEIFTDREGEIIFKKYSPVAEIGSFAKQYAEAIAQTIGHTICIADRDQIVAVAGTQKKDFLGKPVSRQMEGLIHNRESLLVYSGNTGAIPMVQGDDQSYEAQIVYPVISEGDAIGAVAVISREERAKFTEAEQKIAACAASFLGRQMEA